MSLTLLVIGGYGTFGGRIVELLENEPRLTLIIAGRSLARAEAFCQGRGEVEARLVPAVFDREGDLAAQLAILKPDLLVDASGPFQAYGGQPYRVVEAALAAGVDYMDLADGAAFVAGIDAHDKAARAAGVSVLSGVSSFPVLTAAVVRRLSLGMARVESIQAGIAPSPYAGVGLNVIRAIAGYAGQPIDLRRDGLDRVGYPFTEHRRVTIAPPGHLPLRNTLFSLVDVPDLMALQALWPEARTIWMGAGPVPEGLHRLLTILAWLVRWRALPSLLPFAPLMHWATNHLRWGEHRGGMFVEVLGRDATGLPLRRTWHLLAEGDDGPLIPSMAVEALVRRRLAGMAPLPGARAATGDLELEAYEALFDGRRLHTGVTREKKPGPLYSRLLGTAWQALPPELQAIHAGEGIASGRASVERGSGLLSRLAGALVGFPPAAKDVPVTVRFATSQGVETWTRQFGDHSFSSQQYGGQGGDEALLCERFGPLSFAMALVLEDGRLSLVMRRWKAFGVPMPRWLAPTTVAHEGIAEGRFNFHVKISHPLTGLIVRYQGWLVMVKAS